MATYLDDQPQPARAAARFELDYVAERSRLSTFFRIILVIPHNFVLAFYGFAAFIATAIAWFAILFTGRYPAGLFEFNAGYLRWSSRVNAWYLLGAENYPAFSGADIPSYEARLLVDRQPTYSRLLAFFRSFLMIPVFFIYFFTAIIGFFVTLAAWFTILVIGRLPYGMFAAIGFALSYQARSSAYQLLLTEKFPWFDEDETAIGPPVGSRAGAVV